ncbi:MAG: amidohydrolase [Syntrophaceae bacterium]|nr:amidohydrolase [Syntrophaceae bacterium]
MSHPSETLLDILITDAAVLTMAASPQFIARADIGICNGRIRFIRNKNSSITDTSNEQARKSIDGHGKLVMPGLINNHTHLPMVLLRGLADDLSLMEWLNGFIFPAEGRFMNKETVYAGAMLAMAEMILSGTTTFSDSYFFVNQIARAALDIGMRGVVCQGFIDFPSPDIPNPLGKIRLAETFLGRWKDCHHLVKPGLFCHTPYTCSGETLKEIKALSLAWQVPYFIHLAETREEVLMIEEKYKTPPVFYLDALGVLDDQTIAVHCNWLTEAEMDLLRDRNVKVVHCPASNMKLAAGRAPVPALLRRGVRVGLGTDGAASNNNLDLFREMGMAAKIHKVTEMDPTVVNTETVLRMATIEGAKLLGIDERIGTVEVEKAADLILIDLDQPHLTPLYNISSHLVYAASGSDVSTVIIDGKLILEDRKFLQIDLAEIMGNTRKIGAKIASELQTD